MVRSYQNFAYFFRLITQFLRIQVGLAMKAEMSNTFLKADDAPCLSLNKDGCLFHASLGYQLDSVLIFSRSTF